MLRVAAIAFSILLAGCHRQADPPGDAPTGLSVTGGEGQVVVKWDQLPGLTYWIFFQAGSNVTPAATGVPIVFDVQSPSIVANLTNATQYAFVMNATHQDSRAGPSTPVATAVTQLAGNLWTPGAQLGAQNLNGVAFGAVPVGGISTNRIVAVGNADIPGNAGAIFAGNYDYISTNPVGVTSWTQATAAGTLPLGFASDLTAIIYTGTLFVALGADGSVLTSADSVTWTSTSAAPPAITTNGARMNGLTLNPGVVFVAVGNAVNNVGSIFTSTDLINWAPVTPSPTPNDLFSVSFLNGIFVATGANGTILTSADAVHWVPPNSIPSTTNALRSAAYGTGISSTVPFYVVVGDGGTILTSADGTTWTPATLPPLSKDLLSVAFGGPGGSGGPGGTNGPRFVAVGRLGAFAYSDDGLNWQLPLTGSANLASVTHTPAMYIAVGELGANAVSK